MKHWDRAARFWGRIFAINFVFGVVTGIPMEFEFGTNWARFSRLSGGVIGQPLAMEGVFSFFLESAFLGLFLYGEKRISRRMHWFSAVMVWLGSWISGFFIIVTDAWMQHPVAYTRMPDGHFEVLSFWQLLLNPWGLLQYMHNMTGAVVTGAFVMAAVGAFYLLEGRREEYARIFLKVGVIAGVISSIVIIFPTGDLPASTSREISPRPSPPWRASSKPKPARASCSWASPTRKRARSTIPSWSTTSFSFLIYGTTKAEVKGLDQFPQRPVAHGAAAALLRLPHHGGAGTWFVLLMVVAAFLLWRGRLFTSRWALWALLAELSAALHRQHRRLDDRRTGPPALADLRIDAHQRGLLEHRFGQQRSVHAARLHGSLRAAWPAVHGAHLSRNRSRPGAKETATESVAMHAD